jgi:hypothetical protein
LKLVSPDLQPTVAAEIAPKIDIVEDKNADIARKPFTRAA